MNSPSATGPDILTGPTCRIGMIACSILSSLFMTAIPDEFSPDSIMYALRASRYLCRRAGFDFAALSLYLSKRLPGCPQKGLRSYPRYLIRIMPAKGDGRFLTLRHFRLLKE